LFILDVKHTSCALQVNVAQRLSVQRAHHILVSCGWQVEVVHLNRVIKPSISAGWLVEDGNRASDGLGLVEVKRLPYPPHAVDHCVVKEECRIVRAAENIATIAPDCEMACTVHAEEAVGETPLKLILEAHDVLRGCAESDVVEILEGHPFGGCVGSEISLCATWVPFERRFHGDFAGHGGGYGTKVDLQTKFVRELQNLESRSWTYPLNGPLFMQPPPAPEGSAIVPLPPALPLCFTYSPSPPMLVAEPSKTGCFFRSSV
jgi:hypothetical protein